MSNQTPEDRTNHCLELMHQRGYGSMELRAALAAERVSRIEAETNAFLNEMRGVAGSSLADMTSHADVALRGASHPVRSETTAVLEGLPLPARNSATRAWLQFAPPAVVGARRPA